MEGIMAKQKKNKNIIRDGGSTTQSTIDTVYTIQIALHCLNSSMHASIYC